MSRNGSSAPGRREAHAEDSRRALLRAARATFAERGYANASLDDIVSEAGLTKGALYHHFKNKAALLEAVYIEMEEEVVERVRLAVVARPEHDAWSQMLAAVDAFFEGSADPEYVRIVLRDAPHVLGHRHGRELDAAIGLGFARSLVVRLLDQGLIPPLPITATARMLLSTASDVAVTMAYADDPDTARREGTEVVVAVLEGLRALATRAERKIG